MVRLGKSEDAQTILQEVQLEEPCEDATLQAMAICYRETHRRKSKVLVHLDNFFLNNVIFFYTAELTCQIYEAAVRKDPLNEEFLSHLFMGYVRIGDYRKQQLTAMALFKVKPKNPYYFWAVMSILMQVKFTFKKNLPWNVDVNFFATFVGLRQRRYRMPYDNVAVGRKNDQKVCGREED
jgi:N-terminal acetyltransferase B complex non-catalytic subunit